MRGLPIPRPAWAGRDREGRRSMAHADSDQERMERKSDRRGDDRRVEQVKVAGSDRRQTERRSGRERRDN